MPKPRPRLEVLVLVVMLAIFAAAFGLSFALDTGRASIYPQVISGIGMGLVVIELLAVAYQTYLRIDELQPAKSELHTLLREMRGIAPYVLWLLLYVLFISLVGLIIASALFTTLFLFVLGKMKWYQALIGGLAIGVAAFLVTDQLNLALPAPIETGIPYLFTDPFIEFRTFLRLPF